MATPEKRAVTVLLSEEHLRKLIDDHFLKENELSDRVKVARVIQNVADRGFGLPDRPGHDCDDWVKVLE